MATLEVKFSVTICRFSVYIPENEHYFYPKKVTTFAYAFSIKPQR
jgi:hypothetical protein